MNKVMKEMISTLVYLLGVLCLTWLVITFIGQRTEVDGSSMEPMLSNGDNLIVDKISYRFRDPQRYDIIVFPFKYQENTFYIKRIIGLPGETVQIDEQGTIYINGEVLTENYGREIIRAETVGIAANPIVLGEDEYFVMGDNRNGSTDSRDDQLGAIDTGYVLGKAVFALWPLDCVGAV